MIYLKKSVLLFPSSYLVYRRNVARDVFLVLFIFVQKIKREVEFPPLIFHFSPFSMIATPLVRARPLSFLAPRSPLLRAPSNFPARKRPIAMVKTESQDVTVGEFQLPDFEVRD